VSGASQQILKRVAAMAVLFSAGVAPLAAAELAQIPEEVLERLIEPEELANIEETDREQLLSVLALDTRASVRARTAISLQFLSPQLTPRIESTLRRLAADPAPGVRQVLAGVLGPVLARMPGLDRTSLIGSWSASPSEQERYVIASALGWPFDAVGVRSALAALSEDASPGVREAARRSSKRRAYRSA
jgi:hypothetical protein